MPELIAYLEMSQTTLDRQVYWTDVIVQFTDELQTNNIYTA